MTSECYEVLNQNGTPALREDYQQALSQSHYDVIGEFIGWEISKDRTFFPFPFEGSIHLVDGEVAGKDATIVELEIEDSDCNLPRLKNTVTIKGKYNLQKLVEDFD